MNGTIKNLALTTILLAISASAYSSETDPCSGINALATTRGIASNLMIASLVNSPNSEIQSCAIRAAGRTKNQEAAAALLDNVRSYTGARNTKGHYEDNLKARLKAMDSIWALGEIGNPEVMEKLLKLFNESDDIAKINMAIGAGKTKSSGASKFLYDLAAKANESNVVRAAAYEMLEQRSERGPDPRLSPYNGMEKGDLIYTGGIFGIPQGWIGDMPVGHAGIYAGTEVKDGKIVVVIYDCVPDNFKPYGGVRKIYSFYNFTHHTIYAFYGNRVPKVRPTAEQRDKIVAAAAAVVGHHYSDTHFTQKGPVDFDCVGYTEYAYEKAGLNPTPNDQETGWGWPLTPAEQYAATVANVRPPLAVPYAAQPAPVVYTPSPAIITNGAAALGNAFGMPILPTVQDHTVAAPVAVN
ncbi:MAG: hypothetical protein M0011_06980 [Elusimicrobia bacterium]|nr:hypothetical protein [Elusimicrobiota bacterium]